MLTAIPSGAVEVENLRPAEQGGGFALFWTIWGVSAAAGAFLVFGAHRGIVPSGSVRLWTALMWPLVGLVVIFQTVASAKTKLVFDAFMGGAGLAVIIVLWVLWHGDRRSGRS